MWLAVLWGLVQGLTEFLPISSSGHTVLVPALLGLPPPDLATSAVLHLGTLVAVLVYYRSDVLRLLRFRREDGARRLLWLMVLATVPAAVAGLLFEGTVSGLFASPRAVAVALLITGLILVATAFLPLGRRRLEEAGWADALVVGTAQALALVPGISRSGSTIAAAMGLRLDRVEAARLSFLLAIPAIAGAGLLELLDLSGDRRLDTTLLLGVATAAVSGYAAIAVLIRALVRFGLRPFAAYCLVVGALALALLPP